MYTAIFFGIIGLISLFLFIWLSFQAIKHDSVPLGFVAASIFIVMMAAFGSTYEGLKYVDGIRGKVLQSKPEKSLDRAK